MWILSFSKVLIYVFISKAYPTPFAGDKLRGRPLWLDRNARWHLPAGERKNKVLVNRWKSAFAISRTTNKTKTKQISSDIILCHLVSSDIPIVLSSFCFSLEPCVVPKHMAKKIASPLRSFALGGGLGLFCFACSEFAVPGFQFDQIWPEIKN